MTDGPTYRPTRVERTGRWVGGVVGLAVYMLVAAPFLWVTVAGGRIGWLVCTLVLVAPTTVYVIVKVRRGSVTRWIALPVVLALIAGIVWGRVVSVSAPPDAARMADVLDEVPLPNDLRLVDEYRTGNCIDRCGVTLDRYYCVADRARAGTPENVVAEEVAGERLLRDLVRRFEAIGFVEDPGTVGQVDATSWHGDRGKVSLMLVVSWNRYDEECDSNQVEIFASTRIV